MFSVVDVNSMSFLPFIVMLFSIAMLLNGPAKFFHSKECIFKYYTPFMD